jgi:hypothetical protein
MRQYDNPQQWPVLYWKKTKKYASMRVCVLKEYLGSKNEKQLLTTHANTHARTHARTILSVYQAKLFCIQKE